MDYRAVLGKEWVAVWIKDITQLFNENFACLLTRGDMVKELTKTHCHFDNAFFCAKI